VIEDTLVESNSEINEANWLSFIEQNLDWFKGQFKQPDEEGMFLPVEAYKEFHALFPNKVPPVEEYQKFLVEQQRAFPKPDGDEPPLGSSGRGFAHSGKTGSNGTVEHRTGPPPPPPPSGYSHGSGTTNVQY